MADYVIKTPMWTRDGTLYRPGRRNVSDAHATELGLSGAEAGGAGASGEASKGAAVKYPHADILAAGGFKDWAAVQGASDEDLLAVDGIGPSRLEEIRAYRG